MGVLGRGPRDRRLHSPRRILVQEPEAEVTPRVSFCEMRNNGRGFLEVSRWALTR